MLRRNILLTSLAVLIPNFVLASEQTKTLKIGVTAGLHAQILEQVLPIAKKNGLNIKIVEFQDYVQPNAALAAGDLDVNIFQTKPFLDAARELEAAGCRAITTSCGFLALFQRELAAAVSIPVFSSSLMQVDIAWRMLRPDQKVGVLTADKTCLTEQHFISLGCERAPKVIYGLEESVLPIAFNSDDGAYEVSELCRAMEDQALLMVREHPEVGAIVLECTNMPPFAAAVQRKTGLPVFDYTTLANFVYSTLYRTEFQGHM